MSLFDSLASSFGQPASGPGNESGAAPGGVVGAALEFVNQQPGGLNGLIQKFRQQGAGDVVDSWIGTGANKAISAVVLEKVLGSDTVAMLAQKVGIPGEQLTTILASILPNVVDHATPNGELPADGKLQASSVLSSLGGLAALFGKGDGDQHG